MTIRRQRICLTLIPLAMLMVLLPQHLSAGEQEYFRLGDFRLESGETIKDCILGYRTFGTLNSSKSNAILFPTWYTGTSGELEALIGPGKLIDTSQYFVIGTDSFGNGISSSPSNSKEQSGRLFPQFTIGDMVKAQCRLMEERFGISRLHAVIGISMGGMQAFYFAAAHPDKTRKVIPITASPRPTSYDLLFFQTQLAALKEGQSGRGWDTRSLRITTGLTLMASNTPERFNSLNNRENIPSHLKKAERTLREKDPVDLAWQIKAVLKHDIYTVPDMSSNIARLGPSSMLIIISRRDAMVNPAPAREFSDSTGTPLISFDSDCGHYIFQCEYAAISPIVSRFLEE